MLKMQTIFNGFLSHSEHNSHFLTGSKDTCEVAVVMEEWCEIT